MIRPILAGAVVIALAVPAISLGAKTGEPTQDVTTTRIVPEETTSSPSPAATTPTVTSPTVPSPAPTSPGPAPSTTEAPTTARAPAVTPPPQIAGQIAQGRTSGAAPGKQTAGGNPSGATGKSNAPAGSSAAGKRATHPAPSPLTLTPAVPLAFSASLAGIPSFFIESFRIPPFLIPIYQAAGTAYGVPWQVLAAINEVETDYGRDLSVSSAGAEGWMQFLPSSWAIYGVDANGAGFKDPYNPADAIFAAARYLHAAGAATNLPAAIYAYNHSQAYVESVLLRAKLLGGTPSELLGALTGLTESRFPVHAPSHFSDGFPTVPPSASDRAATIAATTIYSKLGAPVIAVQDGQIAQIGDSPHLGRFIVLRDAYGNTYVYAELGSVAKLYPVLQPRTSGVVNSPAPASNEPEPPPTVAASAGTHPEAPASESEGLAPSGLSPATSSGLGPTSGLGATSGLGPTASLGPTSGLGPTASLGLTPGLGATSAGGSATTATSKPSAPAGSSAFAPSASTVLAPASASAFAPAASTRAAPAASTPATRTPGRVFRDGPDDVYLHPLRAGATVIAGTVLGHIGTSSGAARPAGSESSQPHMLFQIRPAGVGAPLIDPKPILDGWVALENSSIFRANGRNPFLAPTAGQVLLESKEQLERQILENPGIAMHPCERSEVMTGRIDRRVLATLEFLEVSGLKPTVSALECGHSHVATASVLSAYSRGRAVDISAINGIPIAGHQGTGSITDTTIRKLLTLQGSMQPSEIVSLMSYPHTNDTLALADHYNHIEIEFGQKYSTRAHLSGAFSPAITPGEWIKLIARLGEIPNPTVASKPSAASIPDHPGAPAASGTEPGGNH